MQLILPNIKKNYSAVLSLRFPTRLIGRLIILPDCLTALSLSLLCGTLLTGNVILRCYRYAFNRDSHAVA